MTFDAYETSLQDGQPARLYRFEMVPRVWTWTSSNQPITHIGEVYSPVYIQDNGPRDPAEMAKAELSISVARDSEVAELYRAYPPGQVMAVTVYELHESDPDAESRVRWIGRVLGCDWSRASAELKCEPYSTSLKRTGLRRKCGRNCDLVLYSQGNGKCNVDPNTYRLVATIDGISANVLTINAAAGQADDYYAGGYLYHNSAEGLQDMRMILDHTGDQITIAAPLRDALVGEAITLYPGCDHTTNDCVNKFSNGDNCGCPGKNTPRLNPYEGDNIF